MPDRGRGRRSCPPEPRGLRRERRGPQKRLTVSRPERTGGVPATPRRAYESVASTQELAVGWAREGAEAGSRVVAERQWAGRGRLERSWSSPPGGLYLSVIVREPAHAPTLFPLAVGERLRDGLARRFGVACLVKWPNDLVVPDARGSVRKLGGVLTDQVPSPTLGTALVAGIGLNVSTPPEEFPPELRDAVTTLTQLSGREAALDAAEEVGVDAALSAAAELGTSDGAIAARARCRSALYGVGRPVRVDGRPAGVLTDLAPDGALMLERSGQLVEVRAGDLVVEGEPT